MRSKPAASGFSLIEVILAVALFAATVTVILALLPGLSRRSTETADRLTAQRLPDAVRTELRRLAVAGVDSLAGQVPAMNSPLSGGFALVATRNGARLAPRNSLPNSAGSVAEDERYYLIECWQFPEPPLRHESGDAALALVVRVSWPYAENPARPATASSEFVFTLGLSP